MDLPEPACEADERCGVRRAHEPGSAELVFVMCLPHAYPCGDGDAETYQRRLSDGALYVHPNTCNLPGWTLVTPADDQSDGGM